jgi:hypothetical protein
LYADTKPVWGRFDAASLQVETTERPGLDDVDLVDRLVAEAVATGSEVVATDFLSGDHEWIAIRRY